MNIENAKNRLINNSVEISYSQRLAIYDLLEELEADKLEAYKAIVKDPVYIDDDSNEFCQHCKEWFYGGVHGDNCIVNKANKYIEQLDNKTNP